MIDIEETFNKYDDEFLEFDDVIDKVSNRRDLCAFILLDKLAPSSKPSDIISASEHDEIFLDFDMEMLAKNASEDDIITLTRCGIRFNSEFNCLCMYVCLIWKD